MDYLVELCTVFTIGLEICSQKSSTKRKINFYFILFEANFLILYIYNLNYRISLSNCLPISRKGRFSEEEDRKIMLYMECATSSNKQFAELAKILGRTRQSVWLRYQSLKKLSSPNFEAKEKKDSKYGFSDQSTL